MTEILDHIAELTKLRDRHELDVTFAALVFELSGALCLTLWRAAGHSDETRMRRCVTLPSVGGAERLRGSAICRRCMEAGAMTCMPLSSGTGSRLALPVQFEGHALGVVEMVCPAPLNGPALRCVESVVRIFANQSALLDYAERDELTGLWNRHSFSTSFAQKRLVGDIVVAVVDIDHFKRINDVYGHPYGDEVLILMARLMEACFGANDGVFRFGGEEFLVLLTGVSLEQAWVALEAFRSTVQAAKFPQVGQVTVSIGFSAVDEADTGASAFGRSDEALYMAKQRGRNQVQCFEALVKEGTVKAEKQYGSPVELF